MNPKLRPKQDVYQVAEVASVLLESYKEVINEESRVVDVKTLEKITTKLAAKSTESLKNILGNHNKILDLDTSLRLTTDQYTEVFAEKEALLKEVAPYRKEAWNKNSDYLALEANLEQAMAANEMLHTALTKKEAQGDKLLDLVFKLADK